MSTILRPAEFVLPGHPDKIADAIADSLVLEAHRREPRALVGVEVAVHRDKVFVTGRIACEGASGIDVEAIVSDVYRQAGYNADWYPAPEQITLVSDLCLGPLEDGEAEYRELADDQAICIGYANHHSATNHLPVEHWLAGRLARRLHDLRAQDPTLGLGPDGKVIVVVREEQADEPADRPPVERWSLESFSCSLQRRATSDGIALHRAVRLALEAELREASEALPRLSAQLPERLTVNGAGSFEVGGPEGDNGLSGKKLVADAYGPRVPIGGGAWSGKDFFKADRAGGLHARRLAKLVVRLGLATEARVTLAWFPGDRDARVLAIETPAGQDVPAEALADMVDLSLRRSGETFPTPDLLRLARWGHFGDASLPWEREVRV